MKSRFAAGVVRKPHRSCCVGCAVQGWLWSAIGPSLWKKRTKGKVYLKTDIEGVALEGRRLCF